MFSLVLATTEKGLILAMHFWSVLALTWAFACWGGANAAAPSGAPSWAAHPSGEDIARAYPASEARRSEPGQVILGCRAEAGGRLSGCIALAATNESFAKGGLKLGPNFRLHPTTSSGQSVEGLVIIIPIIFNIGAVRPADLVYTFGSPAFLLTQTDRPGQSGSIACGTPDTPRWCTPHPITWREGVGLPSSSAVVATLGDRADSTLDCRVGKDGKLEACTLTGDFTAQESERLMSLIGKLRAPDAARDGQSTAGGRVVVPLPWRALSPVAAAYLTLDPAAADQP